MQTDSKKQTTTHSLGLASSYAYSFNVPAKKQGFVVTFTDGDLCGNGDPRTTVVKVLCSSSSSPSDIKLRFDGETSHCVYAFTLMHPAGCSTPAIPPWDEPTACAFLAAPNSAFYTPRLLARPVTSPYHDDADDAFDYDFNICAPVACVGGGFDPTIAVGSCQHGTNAKQKPVVHAAGRLASTTFSLLSGDQEGFRVTIGDGMPCSTGTRTTVITVLCTSFSGSTSISSSPPETEYVGEREHCVYEFIMRAGPEYGACPQSTNPPSPPPALLDACPERLSYSANKWFYSPRALALPATAAYSVDDSDNGDTFRYTFNVCGAVSGCGESDGAAPGACQTELVNGQPSTKQYALGMANQVLVETDLPLGSGFSLFYYGGTVCHDNNAPRSTVVHAICDPDVPASTPIVAFVDETAHCRYEFTLTSAAACPQLTVQPPAPMSCAASLSSKRNPSLSYDLTALGTPNGFTLPPVEFDEVDYSFAVNLCGSVSCPGSHMEAGKLAVGCQSWTDDKGKSHSRALGLLDACELTPSDDDTGFVVRCGGGDECTNGDERVLVLTALCDASKAQPAIEFVEESSHCVYDFVMRAAAACPRAPASPKRSGGLGVVGIFLVTLLVACIVGGAGFAIKHFYFDAGAGSAAPDLATLVDKCMGWCSALGGSGSRGGNYRFERLATDDPDGNTVNI